MAQRYQTPPVDVAEKGVFVSHETFTPARGGSSAAEIAGLRAAFGEKTSDVVIANIKGYTGHAMGAGLEDVLALLMLNRQEVPAIPNLTEPDENLGALRYSEGGSYDLNYAVRLAAGFGSQLALGIWRRRALTRQRIDTTAHMAWLREVTGWQSPAQEVVKRVLRVRQAPAQARALPPAPQPPKTVARADRGCRPMLREREARWNART